MGLKDDIKALIANAQNKPTDPPATPPADPPADPPPNEPPTDPPADPPADPPESFTREDVAKMLADQANETQEALAEMIKGFTGNGAPPISGPAAPVETGDFSAWNKEIKKIAKNDPNSKR